LVKSCRVSRSRPSPNLGRKNYLGREFSTGRFRQHGEGFCVSENRKSAEGEHALRFVVVSLVSLSLVALPAARASMAAPAVRVLVDAAHVLSPELVPPRFSLGLIFLDALLYRCAS